ncbi:kinesin-like protein KIF18B [Strix aluco]|uniref:kinesin-like protein KIF18B n=1 Tax=Strix aluco TaxID=111821 RepID=UPI003DA68410
MVLGPPPQEGSVAVVVRVRPPAPCERERATHSILQVVDQHILVFDPEEHSGPPSSVLPTHGPKHHGKDLKFVFDRVFGEGAAQEEVFQHTTHELLDSVLNGYNCSVFAYGATGAGKTYTMLGSDKSPGIMYLTMVELYKRIEARKEEKSCEVLVSYQEVYNEQIHDLLEPKGPLAIREDPEKGVVVQGLSFHQPASAEQLLEMLANGNRNRTQHPTDANTTSSRSHAIFQIYVKQQDRTGGLTHDLQVAKMSLIDLAGSERASVANTKGERLREGANINRSLLALINVINALAETKSKKSHIPYRDSKLTRLLKDSIGGNCRTIMIAAVSPSVLAYEDTYNTLKYASRAKEIKLSLKSNVTSSDSHVSNYAITCERLRAEVADLRAKLRVYEDAARESQNQALAPLAPSSFPEGLPRLEEAVPQRGVALDAQRESDGEQQELGAGQPVGMPMELEEEAPEEMPPSSPRATHQTDVQLEPKTPRHLLQGLSGSRAETLLAAILKVARKQYTLLKATDLLTPAMVSEFEDLERLVSQEAGVSGEQATSPKGAAEVGGASPAQRMQQDCEAKVSVAVPSTPVTSGTVQCLQDLAPLCSPTAVAPSPIKRRMTTRSHVPLVNSAAQNRRTLPAMPVQILNETFEISRGSNSPSPSSLPEFSIWDSVQSHLNKQDGPVVPKACAPVFAAKRSSIPRPSVVSKPPAQKRRRVESAALPTLDKLQSCSTLRSAQPSCAPPLPGRRLGKPSSRSTMGCKSVPCGRTGTKRALYQPPSASEHPSGPLTWKGSSRTSKELVALGSAPPAPTPQPMKLLC